VALSIQASLYGRLADGRPVEQFALRNDRGDRCKLIGYGATLVELLVADRAGGWGDVVLGYDRLDDYVADRVYLGATIGRVAGRIARGRFRLAGVERRLTINDGPNSLHGGLVGFSRRLWGAEAAVTPQGPAVEFSYVSPDGEEGYPGNVEVALRYTLTHAGALRLDYRAVSDRPTPLNLTNHSYFNLAGCGTILDHELRIDAVAFTPTDDALLPTGAIAPVGGAIDFTARKRIGRDWAQLQAQPRGYDHNFVLADAGPDPLRPVASVHAPASGRVMEVSTDLPCVQLYTGNFLGGAGADAGKGGKPHRQYAGLCLETQRFPDAMNHPGFPPCVLQPGETFRTTTVYAFGVE